MADTSAVLVEFGAKIDNLLSGISDAKTAISDFATSAAEALAAAFSIDAIASFVDKMTELNVQTERAAALMGVSTANVDAFDIAAKVSGTSLEAVSNAMVRLGRNLQMAESNGMSPAAAAFRALGINVKEFIALPADEKLYQLSDIFSRLKDGTEKDAAATLAGGRAFAQMIPLLNEGSAQMREFNAIVDRAGSRSFPEFEAAAKQLHLQMIEVQKSFQGAGMTIFTVFQPALSGLYRILTDLVEAFTKSAREGGAMGVLLAALTTAVRLLATALVISVKAMETLWEVTKTAVFAMGESFMALGRIIKDAVTLNWGDISAAWTDFTAQMGARSKIISDNMDGIFKQGVDQLKVIWKDGADAHFKIDQDKNLKLTLLNRDAMSAAIAAAQERIKLADMEYQQTADRIKNQYGNFFFTEQAKTQALLAALNKRHDLEMAAVADEMKAASGSHAAYQKALNEKLTLDQKYAMDKQKILEASAKEEEKTWTTGLSAITSSFNSQLRGMLAGTTSFAQASKAIAGDMIIKIIELGEKEAVAWIAKEMTKTAATTAGVAARTGAEEAGMLANLGTYLTDALAFIGAQVGKVFAALSAFFSTMGPAGLAIAAGLAAGVGAAAVGMIKKFDVGTNYVTQTGLALIHQGEQIVPAAGSGPYTGGGNGAPNVTLHITNNGGMTAAMIQQQARQIAQAVAEVWRFQPSTRPVY